MENTPQIGGFENYMLHSELKFEMYFFFGSLVGSFIAAFWLKVINQKLTSSDNGKL
jgi:hypothetical protein